MSRQLERGGELPRHRGVFTEGSTGRAARLEGGCHDGREDGQDGRRPSRQPALPRFC